MTEEKNDKLEKVGSFISATFNKIVNLIIFLIIVGLIVVIGLFWHNDELDKQKMEGLERQNVELKEELEKSEMRGLGIEKENVEVESGELQLSQEKPEEEIGQTPKGDYYCETDSDCVVKNVPSCDCYPNVVKKPRCLNKNSGLDQIILKCGSGDEDRCDKNVEVASCSCIKNKCETLYKK